MKKPKITTYWAATFEYGGGSQSTWAFEVDAPMYSMRAIKQRLVDKGRLKSVEEAVITIMCRQLSEEQYKYYCMTEDYPEIRV